jgi:GTP pyrophosphokinase
MEKTANLFLESKSELIDFLGAEDLEFELLSSTGDLEPARQLSSKEEDQIWSAYDFARQRYAGKERGPGEEAILHPLRAARIVFQYTSDAEAVIAALLHDVTAGSIDVVGQQVREQYGSVVAALVEGVRELEHYQQRSIELRNAEDWRRFFFALASDPRVVLIKLAKHLDKMRNILGLPPNRQTQVAKETEELYAPLAEWLGIWRIKAELEDLAFHALKPDAYRDVADKIEHSLSERKDILEQVIQQVKQGLAGWRPRLDVDKFEITGRPKHVYSIWKKMLTPKYQGYGVNRIYDKLGVRIIVNTVEECYAVLGFIHSRWTPIPGEFDDYIGMALPSGYQSLHTAVRFGAGPQDVIEFQIRTHEMHRNAELGIAAHWRYKEGGKRDPRLEAKIRRLRSILDWREDGDEAQGLVGSGGLPPDAIPAYGEGEEEAEELVDSPLSDDSDDRVYVFTPRGDIVDLPAKSTPVDFAYAIHTEVGHRCRGARVNGRLVSLDHQLQNGDQVEIVTAKRGGGPNRDWLIPALGYVHTARARNKIRQWFRRQDREQNVVRGRELVDKELRRLNVEVKLDEVAALFHKDRDNPDKFFAQVGTGDIQPATIATKLVESVSAEEDLGLPPPKPAPLPTLDTSVRVMGVGDLLTHLARCCNPAPGDPIVGYITRGRGVTIHREDCPNVLSSDEVDRLITVSWGGAQKTYPVRVSIRAYDRPRLLQDLVEVIGDEEVSMSRANIATLKEKNLATFTVVLELTDVSQLSRVLSRMEQVPSVLEARRIAG